MNKKEFLDKYSCLEVTFVSYFKYRFTYTAVYDNKRITVMLGDPDGDIYRDNWLAVEKISDYGLLYWDVEELK